MLRVTQSRRSARVRPARDRRWNAGRTRAFVAALALVAAATTMFLITEAPPCGRAGTAAFATVLIAAIVLANLTRLGSHVFAPSTLFLAALAAFHVGMIVPVTAGLDEPPLWLDTIAEPTITAALLAIVLAFACLEIGLVLGWHGTRVAAPSPRPIAHAAPTSSPLHGGGLAVATLAAAAVFTNLSAIGFDRFFESSYGYEIYAGSDSRLLQMGLFWLLPAAALVCFAGARRGRETRRALVVVAGATGLLLCAGDRGGAIALLAGTLVVWTATRGPVSRRVAVGAPLIVLVLVPTVATLRQLPRNAVDLASIRDAAIAASPLAALTEMGATFRPLVETMRLVPEAEPYRLGRTYVAATTRVLPNLGLTRADDDWRDAGELSPDLWITYTVAPWTFAAYGGLGYSAIAEPYLNFGVLGIAAYFLALGLVLGRLEVRLAATPSRRTVALAAVVFMSFLLTVRNDLQNFVRPAVWDVGLIALIEMVHGVRPARRRTIGAGTPRPSRIAPSASAPTLARGAA